MSKHKWLLLLLPLLTYFGTTAVPPPPHPLPRRAIPALPHKRGVHLLLDDGRNHWPADQWPAHLQAARDLVGEWGTVTQLVRLDDLNPNKWQRFMDLCADLHLTPILRLATTFDTNAGSWTRPPTDGNGRSYRQTAWRYARFVAALAWPTDAHFVIVGNEPNHGEEWGGRPDAAAYGRFLQDTAVALKSADPGARVLNAPLDAYAPHSGSRPLPNGFWYIDAETFLDEMSAAHPDVFRYIDAWASHPYTPGFAGGPWEQSYQVDLLHDAHNPAHAAPPPGLFNRGINGYEWELWKVAGYGITGLPVYITETGWRHAEAVTASSDAAVENGRSYPDAATVRIFLDLALNGNNGRFPDYPQAGWTPWNADPRVVTVTPFALSGSPTEWGHTNWLQLSAAGAVEGVWVSWPDR